MSRACMLGNTCPWDSAIADDAGEIGGVDIKSENIGAIEWSVTEYKSWYLLMQRINADLKRSRLINVSVSDKYPLVLRCVA